MDDLSDLRVNDEGGGSMAVQEELLASDLSDDEVLELLMERAGFRESTARACLATRQRRT